MKPQVCSAVFVTVAMGMFAIVSPLGCQNRDGNGYTHEPAATERQVQGWELYQAKYRDPALELASGMVTTPDRVQITDDGDVLLNGPDGKLLWKKHLGGELDSVRPPDWVLHGGRVFVVRYPGIVALGAASGDEVWKCDEPSDRLVAHGDLLVASKCDYDTPEKRWLVARRVTDGSVVWRTPVPKFPNPAIQVIGDFFVVRDVNLEECRSQVISAAGKTVVELSECIYSGHAESNGDIILLTNKRIMRFCPSQKKIAWQVEEATGYFCWPFDDARCFLLGSGDLMVYFFSPIGDSGVQLQRIEPLRGTVRWTAQCDRLGVMHSKYKQNVYVKELGRELLVVSRGERYFVELLDLATGSHRQRFEFESP